MKVYKTVFIVLILTFHCLVVQFPLYGTSDESISSAIVRANGDPMCGPYCLFQIARVYGINITLEEAVSKCNVDWQRGVSMQQLTEAIRTIGLSAIPVKISYRELLGHKQAAVLLLNFSFDQADHENPIGHFVLLDNINESGIRIIDGDTIRELSKKQIEKNWSGNVILINPSDDIAANATPNQHIVRFVFIIPFAVGIFVGVITTPKRRSGL